MGNLGVEKSENSKVANCAELVIPKLILRKEHLHISALGNTTSAISTVDSSIFAIFHFPLLVPATKIID